MLQGYKTAEDYARDYRSVMNTNKEEGRNQRDREIVQNMMKKNYNIEQIIVITGLTPDVIKSYSI